MKKLFLLAVSLITITALNAIPAYRGPITKTKADGTTVTVFQHGNEFFHWTTNEKNEWIDETTLQPLDETTKQVRLAKCQAAEAKHEAAHSRKLGLSRNLAPRGLIILVNFKDKEFVTPYDTIANMINGDNFTRRYSYVLTYNGINYNFNIKSSGSAKQYFHDQSWGQYQPIFDVVGPVTVSKNYAYYGANDDANVGYMIKEACELADQEKGVDFTLYDNNNDGTVDFVYVIYAGYGEADGGDPNTVWPHNFNLSHYIGVKCKVDGKFVDSYACSNEINSASKTYAGIGTFCHEFSHVLGLPDLYETTNPAQGIHTLLDWSILDYGPYLNDGNTPPSYSAYERFFMGWLTPRVLTEPENVTLSELNQSHEALLVCQENRHNLDGLFPKPKTFYILENRQQSGWDQFLPGHGLLITKIQHNERNWLNNRVNNNAQRICVYLVEAKDNTTKIAKATDAYPIGKNHWTDLSEHEVTNIVENGTQIQFLYRQSTPIEEIQEQNQVNAAKVLKDHQIMIIRNGETYDLTGRKINE